MLAHTLKRIYVMLTLLACASAFGASTKPRLLVLTDIGGDPDDQQSIIRLMVYANEFDIEGLIATASGVPGELKEKTTKPELIREIVRGYATVHPNLARQAEGFPTAEYLLGRIKSGGINRGRDAIGEDRDTEGSEWIISAVDRDDPRPMNIAIWGGQTDFGQALWRVRRDRGAAGVKKFIGKLRVFDINDQDKIADWIWDQFPGLFYVLSSAVKGADKREGAYRGMYLGGDESMVSRAWMERNIRDPGNPLGRLYPTQTWTAPNPHSAIKEGDTPSWFFFLPNGLNDPDHPEWGGWGGRHEPSQDRIYRDARDTVSLGGTNVTHARATVWRWRGHYQNDFEARLDWCHKANANHAPIAVLNGDRSKKFLSLSVPSGRKVQLSTTGSTDPDGDTLRTRFYVYPEAGTFKEEIALTDNALIAPKVKQPETIHVICEVSDDGFPSLTVYRRVILTVNP